MTAECVSHAEYRSLGRRQAAGAEPGPPPYGCHPEDADDVNRSREGACGVRRIYSACREISAMSDPRPASIRSFRRVKRLRGLKVTSARSLRMTPFWGTPTSAKPTF